MLEAALSELSLLGRKALDAAAVLRKKQQVCRTFSYAAPLVEQLQRAFELASRLDRNIAPLRAPPEEAPGPRRFANHEAKPRAAAPVRQTAVKPSPEPARRIERLVIGSQGVKR
jgi:hypothetical protein